jgi:hypothetical protein
MKKCKNILFFFTFHLLLSIFAISKTSLIILRSENSKKKKNTFSLNYKHFTLFGTARLALEKYYYKFDKADLRLRVWQTRAKVAFLFLMEGL